MKENLETQTYGMMYHNSVRNKELAEQNSKGIHSYSNSS
jgi:hypothetical protein